jgi:hypothetical protein
VRALSLQEAHLRSSLSRASSCRPRAAARAAAPSLLRPEPLRRMLVVQEGREATIYIYIYIYIYYVCNITYTRGRVDRQATYMRICCHEKKAGFNEFDIIKDK